MPVNITNDICGNTKCNPIYIGQYVHVVSLRTVKPLDEYNDVLLYHGYHTGNILHASYYTLKLKRTKVNKRYNHKIFC